MKKLVLILTLSFSSNSIADLPELNEPWHPEIPLSSIWNSFTDGNFTQAWKMLNNEIYRRAKEVWQDEKTWASATKFAANQLEKLLNQPNKSEEEIGADIANLIASTIEPYSTQEYGSLNIKIEHSIMFETTFISWNHLIQTDSGPYITSNCVFEFDPVLNYNVQICTGSIGKEYLTQYPDYSLYRVVNGVETLITKIKGESLYSLQEIRIGTGLLDFFKDAKKYKEFYDEFGVEQNRLVWEDPKAGDRNQGETLSYKIVADNSAYKIGDLGHSNSWEGFVDADTDGDRKMDYIPTSVYSTIWVRQNPWFVPIITSTLL